MKPRWVIVGLFLALTAAAAVHVLQLAPVWSVAVPEYTSLLQLDEAHGLIFLDEPGDPTIHPGRIITRSLATGEVLATSARLKNDLPWHDYAYCVISPDRRYVTLGEGFRRDSRGVLALHDLATGRLERDWSLREFDRGAVAFSADGRHLLLGAADAAERDPNHHHVRLYDLAAGGERRLLVPREHDEGVGQVLGSDDLSHVAVRLVNRRNDYSRVVLVEVASGKVLGSWDCRDAPLLQYPGGRFAFLAVRGEAAQFVELQVGGAAPRLVAREPLWITGHGDGGSAYRGIPFDRFAEERPSGVQSCVYLEREPNPPALVEWLRKLGGPVPLL